LTRFFPGIGAIPLNILARQAEASGMAVLAGQFFSLNNTCPFFDGSSRLARQQARANKPEKKTTEKRGAAIFVFLFMRESF